MRDRYHTSAIQALREEDREFDHAVGAVGLRKQLERDGFGETEITEELRRFREDVLLGY
ncbi:MAG: hypothetical protein Q8N19_12710 [Phenylobacterium sp.]|uniref:hypothetical protein n=1 Tax=Phenylobacterium sp. TaxID=1871053 RepID=UPI0027365588|nr:hypothetical protein [Phenylobacterium sp.]MDP3117962.1 hypothetical protein [Phenylobacterium sp.]